MKLLPAGTRHHQHGGFALGLIVGLLLGLAIALGVALYIAKVPVPFVDKVGHRSADQDAADNEKLKNWDPNAGLGGKPVPRPAAAASGASAPTASTAGAASPTPPVTTAPATAATNPATSADSGAKPAKPARDPAAILAGETPADAKPVAAAPEGITYYVQAGAFSSQGDAEQQRAKLAMQGVTTKIAEREQGGRTVYRVRLGPIDSREEAEKQQERLKGLGADAMLVRVERNKP